VSKTARVASLDVVRGLAIVCMLIAHGMPFFWTTGVPEGLAWLTGAINDVASPLFGLAMGAAAALVWSRPGLEPARRVLTDTARGIIVFALGILLVELDTWVAIVLHVLGVLMVIGIPIAALGGAAIRSGSRRPTLLGLLATVTVASFVLAPWITRVLAPTEQRRPNGALGGWGEIWVALMAGHSYRAVSLLPFFALGALLAATGWLSRPRHLVLRILPIAVVLVIGYVATGGFGGMNLSGDHVDQARDLTLVLMATVLAGLLVAWRPVRGLGRIVALLGTVALSLYALQLLILRPLMEVGAWQTSVFWGWVCMLTLVLVPSAVLIGWRRFLGPGPLERMVALATGKGHAS